MTRLKLTIQYDGTDFVGWQLQPNGRSVQGVLEKALEELLGVPTRPVAAGRTDSGVHARAQVVAFDTDRTLPPDAYQKGLNSLLPPDLSVIDSEVVDADFDPRRHASGKRYRYFVLNQPLRQPLFRRTHHQVYAPLDVAAMREAAATLVGEHDFSAFRAADCEAPHARRKLRELSVNARDLPPGEIIFDVEGTAFLKHMVRNLVGTLLLVGKGKQPARWVAQVLASKDRNAAGPTAPPHGLVLWEVSYDGSRRT